MSEDKKVPKLHELLAVEADLANTAKAMTDDAAVAFTKKSEHFRGLVTTTTYFDAARAQENVTEEKVLVTTVGERLRYALKFAARYFDALLQKEATNQNAKADLIVDGVTMATDVPATFLLGMETRLRNMRELLLVIPTNDPALDWSPDTTASVADVFKAPPVVRMKTEKQVRSKVLYDATDKHPAQIEKWAEDVPVAKVEQRLTSGMWTPLRKATTIANLDNLLVAVKKARQRANSAPVVEATIADKMIDYILS